MKKHVILILTAGLFIGADAAKDAANDSEIRKLQGAWVLESGQKDGKPISDEDTKNSKIVWKGLDSEIESPHQSKETMKAKCTLDPAKSPKEMDWVRSVGPGAGKVHHAIYEFLADGRLRVCFAPAGMDRPKDFKAEAGSGHILHVWKKAKE